MLLALLLALLIYTNVRLAVVKGLNPWTWGVISLVAFIIAYLLLGSAYFFLVYKGPLNPDAARAWAEQYPLKAILMLMLGIGGVLIVRFILERKQSVGEE
jgi:hypothetical protein